MTDHTTLSPPDATIDPGVWHLFNTMCETLPRDQISSLTGQVTQHLADCRRALRANEFLDINLAEKIAEVLTSLLAGYGELPAEHQALIVGATRYFVAAGDAESDLTSVLGWDDDAQVLNHVLDVIGRQDLKVAL
ncbi:MAG: hypothetical protein U9R25_16075 [Chloroflexota bacterium]|nr:hypothetical protein [Chloroflexota bacterium]